MFLLYWVLYVTLGKYPTKYKCVYIQNIVAKNL